MGFRSLGFAALTFLVSGCTTPGSNSFAFPEVGEEPIVLDLASVSTLRAMIETCDQLRIDNDIVPIANYVCFSGLLEENDDARLNQILVENDDIDLLVIRSGGGVAEYSIAVAEVILNHELDVLIWDYCNSGCSNYVFLAGERKILLEGSLMGFHGGTFRSAESLYGGLRDVESLADLTDDEIRQRAEELWNDPDYEYHRQERFFEEISLSSEIIYEIRRLNLAQRLMELNVHSRVEESDTPAPEVIQIAWFPSPQRMHREYGVPGILCEVCAFDDEYTLSNSVGRGFILFESLD